MTVDRGVFACLDVEVVADVTLIGLHHIAAESGAHRDALEHLAQDPAAEGHHVTAVAPLERLEHPALIELRRREVESEARVRADEAALNEPVGRWLLTFLV